MMANHPSHPGRRAHAAAPSRGVALVITLIALVVLLIGAAAMLRALDTSTALAGNLAFRRDLTNQGERAIAEVRKQLLSGGLSNPAALEAGLPGANYVATRLPANDNGVPLVLLDDGAFSAAGMSAANDLVDAQAHITMRYVIDRLCAAAGPFDETSCVAAPTTGDAGGTDWLRKPDGEAGPVYRVTVRINGPRATQAFLQTTFAN